MRYFGGKARLAKELSTIINTYSISTYHEPFCGMFSVGALVSVARRSAADAHADLIELLKATRDGWVGPSQVSEADYESIRNSTPPSALRGFVGFGCSNSGKFFGGYARESSNRNFAANAVSSLKKLAPKIQGVDFAVQNYLDYDDPAQLVYCDPPYEKTTGFTVGKFNSDEFWRWAKEISTRAIVLVSEYSAPPDVKVIWSKPVKTDMNSRTGNKHDRVEKLYCVGL